MISINIDKWLVLDAHNRGDEGNAEYIEVTKLSSLLKMCRVNNLSTIKYLCVKYPALTNLVSEAVFEVACVAIDRERKNLKLIEPILDVPFPNLIVAELISFAAPPAGYPSDKYKLPYHDYKDNTSALKAMVRCDHTHSCGGCFISGLVGVSDGDDTSSDDEEESSGDNEEESSDDDEGSDSGDEENGKHFNTDYVLPCIHLPLKDYIKEWKKRIHLQTENGNGWKGWEEHIYLNNNIRKVLACVLEALGFDSIEAADRIYPCLVDSKVEYLLDFECDWAKNYDEKEGESVVAEEQDVSGEHHDISNKKYRLRFERSHKHLVWRVCMVKQKMRRESKKRKAEAEADSQVSIADEKLEEMAIGEGGEQQKGWGCSVS